MSIPILFGLFLALLLVSIWYFFRKSLRTATSSAGPEEQSSLLSHSRPSLVIHEDVEQGLGESSQPRHPEASILSQPQALQDTDLPRESENHESDPSLPIEKPVVVFNPLLLPVEKVFYNRSGEVLSPTKDELEGKRVVRFLENIGCDFTLSKELGRLSKVFIERCTDCVFTIECRILTQNIEITWCKNVEVRLKSRVEILQVDLSNDVAVICDSRSCRKVFHSGVERLKVCMEDTDTCVVHDYKFPEDPILTEALPDVQYVTQIVGQVLKTEKIDPNSDPFIPKTFRELETCSLDSEEEN